MSTDGNSSSDYEQELLVNLSHIEDLTTQQLINIVKKILVAVSTGSSINSLNSYYQSFYDELEKRFAVENKTNPNTFSDLWQFHESWNKEGLTTYSSRRAYVAGLYRNTPKSTDKYQPYWDLMNGDIVAVSRSRFDSGHYSDAVEAAFKEINSRIKSIVKQSIGEEYDGVDLMNRAFSAQKPVIILDDLNTVDGKNIQQGYLQLYAGAMTGIRNPKAHSNIIMEPDETIHLLFLASHLLNRVQDVIDESKIEIADTKNRRYYIRAKSENGRDDLIRIKTILEENSDQHGLEVILVIGEKSNKQAILLPGRVKDSKSTEQKFISLLGSKNVKIQ